MADEIGKIIDLASQRPVEQTGWMARLKAADGVPIPTLSNALVILANDPELKGMLAYNEFASRGVLRRAPPSTEGHSTSGPFPRTWEEPDRAFLLAYFQRLYNTKFKMETISAAMSGAASFVRFHPVRQYLSSLVWDKNPRLTDWLTNAFGTDHDPYHHAVGTKFLLAAVRRVFRPGCKFDSMLVLEGDQDIGKSRACRVLFGDEWFTDALPPDLSGRDMSDALQGLWGIEFAEIEHLLRSEPETIKAFLSRQVDRYRPSYGRMPVERPRQCVFVGTTNSDDYARDSTGNRRIWPVRCAFVDVEWIAENRDQLWAEAVAAEPSAALWIDDEVVRAEVVAQQSARRDEDPWEDGILTFIASKVGTVTIPQILQDHLALSKDKQDKRSQMRAAAVLRRAGWRRVLRWEQGKPGRYWVPPA